MESTNGGLIEFDKHEDLSEHYAQETNERLNSVVTSIAAKIAAKYDCRVLFDVNSIDLRKEGQNKVEIHLVPRDWYKKFAMEDWEAIHNTFFQEEKRIMGRTQGNLRVTFSFGREGTPSDYGHGSFILAISIENFEAPGLSWQDL